MARSFDRGGRGGVLGALVMYYEFLVGPSPFVRLSFSNTCSLLFSPPALSAMVIGNAICLLDRRISHLVNWYPAGWLCDQLSEFGKP